ncbi:nucleolar complex protein 3 homolog [Trifolium pratense]|uniref:nucleolar complex protein 3 homolog n=1 Tax=Trifolium pratense TaxID=57577 RepID=UPI001E691F12|nr:nucleolar complex protein 3 homolog [Trifolium pratense]
MGKKQKSQQILLPPDLPPEIPDEEVEFSDDDVKFVNENRAYASLLSNLDTQSITKHVTRVADAKEDALEKLYEQRRQKTALKKEKEETGLQVDRVDALPVKTLDGKVYYRTATKTAPVNAPSEEETGEDGNEDMGLVKLTKAEKRAKLKKIRKEGKKQGKEVAKEELEEVPQAAVLAAVKEDLKVEEDFESKKCKLAEFGNALLTDPESNIKFLKEMVQISKDNDDTIVKLGLLSLLAVFRDIIPGYRIRLPTEKEQEMKVSKTVKKMRFYESTLLSAYKTYLQRLIALEKKPLFQLVAVRCICSLLDSNPHFNFRETLLDATIRNISSSNETIRQLCCSTIKSLFTNEGKHGGEATVEAVRLISYKVKDHNCQLHPDSIEVFLSLSFDEDLAKAEKMDKDQKFKNKKGKKRKNAEASNQLPENDRKKSRQDSISKTREEVEAEYKAASFTKDAMEKRQMQTQTLSAVFETYFRILKHTMQSIVARPEANPGVLSATVGVEPHPLLDPCLKGLAKFSHLIDLDFLGDLMNHLKILASGGSKSGNTSEIFPKSLTVSERLQCCIVAFKVMRTNLDALNVDLQDFTVHLYNLVLEYRPGRDQGEVLAEALKIMLCDDRQHDMQKAAAFIKRLATLSLCVGSADTMAALVTVKHLLLKNLKCRNLLENDTGGGSVSGTIPKYLPYSTDPNLSGALASVLWEVCLLSKHYHPTISAMATGISSMSTENQVFLSKSSPQQAFKDMSIDQELCFEQSGSIKLNNKKRRLTNATSNSIGSTTVTSSFNEDDLRKKFSSHFMVLHDIKENEKLRSKLDKTAKSLKLFEQYKEQKKKRSKPSS